MCFAGYGVEKNRLYRTVATRNPNEIGGLWKSGPLRACGHDLPVMKMRLQTLAFVARGITGRSFWFSSFSPGYEVRDFSITPGSRDFETPESRVAKGR